MNVLRLAIALSDVESKRFNKILSSIIINIINSNKQSSGDGTMSSATIQKAIYSTYGLEFSTSEIETAIDEDSSLFETYKENNIRYCSLSPKCTEKLKKDKKQQFNLEKCVETFISENNERISVIGTFDKQKIQNIINKYIYNSFNSDKEELAYLMNGQVKSSTKGSAKKYSPNEVKIIRLFLDWDNKEKNKFVFDVVRTAYDYCILTTKENAEESMFSYKKLYLDTNVIFSLAGINGKERLYSTRAFINKSKELHSEIFYTSQTANECRVTLRCLIEQMAAIVKKESYLSYEELKNVFPSSNPAALFGLYCEWAKNKPSRNGDYNSFLTHMMDILNDTLNDLSLQPIENSFLEKNKEWIERNRLLLSDFKEKLGRKHSENATYTDACNFCFVDSIRNKKTSTIKNQDIFFISSDTGLCRWSEQQSVGYINVFLLPSIMYSMMLRFSSRTPDDYKSFNDFVLLSFSSEYITESEYQVKEDLVCAINDLDVPGDAKKKILNYANRELEKQTHKKSEHNEKAVADAVKAGLDNFYSEFNQIKEVEKNEAKKESSKAGYQEGYETAVKNIAKKRANAIVKRRKIIGWMITVFLFVLTIALTIGCICIFVTEKDIKSISGWIMAILALLGGVSIVITTIVNIRKLIVDINYEEIYNKELDKQKMLAEKE